ncbi:MAG: enoyl-CoA hydratase/isomerase family protein, partial [Nevskia sp.]|nr:enoyl-CoA hydratase/isomerase family protein [Nevskia sp.]
MNLPETKNLLLSLDGGILHLTLNRPESRNAMNRGMVEEINAVFDAVREAKDVRAIVMRGAGGHFCAGGDLKEMMAGGLKAPQPGEADPV